MTTLVLVHGAWHGAWCFDRVVPRIRDAGVDVVAVDLPGHGDDAGPFTDLHGDAAHVSRTIDAIDDDVVLVGHSYGGAVITEAGMHDRVRRLVYLCAFALTEEETCFAAATVEAEAAGISYEGRPDAADAIVMHEDGTSTLTPAMVAAILYQDCDDATREWALARLGPQPMVTMAQSPSASAWRTKPSTYAVCANDMAVHPQIQRIMAARCTESLEWPTSHSPFLSRPELVADLVIGLVG